MTKIKRVIIVFIMLFVLVLATIVIRKAFTQNYIDQDIFLDINYMLRYDRTIQERGKPIKTIKEKLDYNTDITVLLVYYDDMVIVYEFDDEKQEVGEFMWAQIESDQYKFGKKDVCVGMTKKEIEKIFRYSEQLSLAVDMELIYDSGGKERSEPVIGYFNNSYDLGFEFIYDENDVVEYIDVFFGL